MKTEFSSGNSSVVTRRDSDRKATDPGSTSAFAMRRRVLGEDILRQISTRASSLAVVVAQPDKRLAKRTQKILLRWCGYTDAERLVHTNKRVELKISTLSYYINVNVGNLNH